MTDQSFFELVQAGGLALFAAAVWYELRQQRIERVASERRYAEQNAQLVGVVRELGTSIEVLLDRAHFKSGPTRRPSEHEQGKELPRLPGAYPVVDPSRERPP